MKAIPTTYAGVRFRSRLEARYALAFDQIGIKWAYEPEGVQLRGGERYLSDFWLPDCRTFVEVKGPTTDRADLVTKAQDEVDSERLERCSPDKPLFVLCDEFGRMFAGDELETHLSRCERCSQWYFRVDCCGWNCRCCGHADGNATFVDDMEVINLPQYQWHRRAA